MKWPRFIECDRLKQLRNEPQYRITKNPPGTFPITTKTTREMFPQKHFWFRKCKKYINPVLAENTVMSKPIGKSFIHVDIIMKSLNIQIIRFSDFYSPLYPLPSRPQIPLDNRGMCVVNTSTQASSGIRGGQVSLSG